MNKSYKLKGMCMASAAVLLTASCSKDAAYDDLFESDAIDMSMQVAPDGITLPFGSSEKIMLTELIDPEDSDVIETDADGKYYIRKAGSIDKTNFKVDPVKVTSNPSIAPIDVTLDAYAVPQDITDLLNMATTKDIDVEGKKLSEINDLVKSISPSSAVSDVVNIKAKADNVDFNKSTSFDLKASNVDKQLVSLSHISPSKDVDLKINLKVTDLPGQSATYSIKLNDVILSLPAFVEIYDEQGVRMEDPTNILTTLSATKKAGSTEAVADLHYIIRGFDFDKDPLINDNGNLLRQSSINIGGKADIEEFSVDLSELVVTKVNGEWQVQIAKPVSFAPVIDPINITIEKIQGRFNPTIKDMTTKVDINLSDDLDFLQKQNVTIDAQNPQIRVDINYNALIKLYTDIDLKSSSQPNKVITYKNVVIDNKDGDGKESIVLSRKDERASVDVTYYANNYLSELLSPVPDNIEVKMSARADQDNDYEFTLGQNIEVSGDYSVNVPFDFNQIRFTYDEECKDVFGEGKDITKYLKEVYGVTAEIVVVNTIPVDVTLDIVIRDKNGKEDKTALSGNLPVIKAGTLDKPVETSIKVEPYFNTETTKDLIFRFEAQNNYESNTVCTFNANQYIQIKSSKIIVKGQKIDLNDL